MKLFDCVPLSLVFVLHVAIVALYHINEISRRAGDVMSYTSFCDDQYVT